MPVCWTETAKTHLRQLPQWLEEDFSAAGSDTVMPKVSAILAWIRRFAAQPNAAATRAGRIAGTREVDLLAGHYLLIYRIRAECFDVLGILPARDPP